LWIGTPEPIREVREGGLESQRPRNDPFREHFSTVTGENDQAVVSH
jgi:hypothetical protein